MSSLSTLEGEGAMDRLVLLACAFAPAEVGSLLEGLSAPLVPLAKGLAESIKGLSSADRHGRLAAAFGVRPDGVERLRRALGELGPGLRLAVLRHLPEPERASFPEARAVAASPDEEDAAEARQAQRLIRECLR